jgi:hypothetical protein
MEKVVLDRRADSRPELEVRRDRRGSIHLESRRPVAAMLTMYEASVL